MELPTHNNKHSNNNKNHHNDEEEGGDDHANYNDYDDDKDKDILENYAIQYKSHSKSPAINF